MNNNDCSIIVSSCDSFSDVWIPFFTLFFKYWPDCPFKIYLLSEQKTYNSNKVFMISLGEDRQWASNLKLALKKIDTPYFIYLQEDYLLQAPVDTKKIMHLLNILIENNAAYIKLRPSPMPKKHFKEYYDIGEIEKGDKYSISNQATIWNRDIFEKFLIDGETGWDTELKGSIRSAAIKEPFLSVYKEALKYPRQTAIKKGVWLYDAVRWCEKEGIIIDKTKRKVEGGARYFLKIIGLLGVTNRLKNILQSPKKKLLFFQN